MTNSTPEKSIIYLPNQDIKLNVPDYIEYNEKSSSLNLGLLSFGTLAFIALLATIDIIAVIPITIVSIGILYLLHTFQQNVVIRKAITIKKNQVETIELLSNGQTLNPIYEFQQPNYFELVILPNKQHFIVSLCQFSTTIQSFLLHESADITLLIESLQTHLGVEIYDTFQSKEREEIIGFRPKNRPQAEPVLFSIIEDNNQLIIQPRTIEQSVIIDYTHQLIKTSAGYQYDTHAMSTLEYKISERRIMIRSKVQTFGLVDIVSLPKGRMQKEFVREEVQKLFKILKSKRVLQHIQF